MSDRPYDAVVIGGGPAGLAGVLWLARYRYRVRLFDEATPRNRWTGAIHGYLGLPDVSPNELRRIGREQAIGAGAEVEAGSVSEVTGEIDRFTVRVADGRALSARRILLCTGLIDIRPEIPGLEDFYGHSIWHCPDCDGPEATGKSIGVIGCGPGIAAYSVLLSRWAEKITVFTDGRDPELPDRARDVLRRCGVSIRTEAIERLEGTDGQVETVCLGGGDAIPVEAVFFKVESGPGSAIAAGLECEVDDEGMLVVSSSQETSVPGVYAAGDITPGTLLAIRAAAEGTRAAVAISRSLIPAELRL